MAFSMIGSSVAARPGVMGAKLCGPSNGARVVAFGREGVWLPGSDPAPWLPSGIPGNFGYDPLGLARDPATVNRLREGELLNARWSMLGVAGMLAVELAGQGNWVEAALWAPEGGSPTYLGSTVPIGLGAILTFEFLAFLAAETSRMPPPLGFAPENEPEARLYPGIAFSGFDPAGLADDPEDFEELKIKELNNGRLSMLAFLGFVVQNAVTGVGPIQNLNDFIADPGNNNIFANLGK